MPRVALEDDPNVHVHFGMKLRLVEIVRERLLSCYRCDLNPFRHSHGCPRNDEGALVCLAPDWEHPSIFKRID
jgi:hypothetical protein